MQLGDGMSGMHWKIGAGIGILAFGSGSRYVFRTKM